MIEQVIAFLGGSICGGVITYFFKAIYEHYLALSRSIEAIRQSHENSIKLLRIVEFNKAASIFRAEFVHTIFMLRKNINAIPGHIGKNSEFITDEILINQEKAKIIFEPFLSVSELEGFEAAWENYKTGEEQCINTVGTESFDQEFSKFYLNHIEILLGYAKPKT